MENVTIRPALLSDMPAVRALLTDYVAWIGMDLAFQEIDAELAGLPGDYVPPRGALLVADEGGQVIGMIGLRPSDGAIYSGRPSHYNWFDEVSHRSYYDKDVTHWMPLPNLPGQPVLPPRGESVHRRPVLDNSPPAVEQVRPIFLARLVLCGHAMPAAIRYRGIQAQAVRGGELDEVHAGIASLRLK